MRNKFLKLTFMALCLSTTSVLHAMIPKDEVVDCSFAASHAVKPEDEMASSSSATSPYVGKYEIRRNYSDERTSGSLTIRQDGEDLILEDFTLFPGSYCHSYMEETIEEIKKEFDFTLIPGPYYHSYMEETIEEINKEFKMIRNRVTPFGAEHLRLVSFVLSALPTEVLKLKYLRDAEKVQYLGVTNFGELHKILDDIVDKIVDKTPRMWVRFQREKDLYFGEMFTLFVESPLILSGASPQAEFRLFKLGSAEHDSLLERSMLFSSSHTGSMPLSDLLKLPSSSSGSRGLVKTTFRTAGANDAAEIKHSAIYASFSYQNNPGAAYSLIINHRTKDDKGSIVRVHNPNARAYINLGRLSPSVSFSNEVF
ncbi:hypothetical protein QM565_09090 [Geitlerinema splendidum]|nr:hypothetical protein [Geitlerinema splendidum]